MARQEDLNNSSEGRNLPPSPISYPSTTGTGVEGSLKTAQSTTRQDLEKSILEDEDPLATGDNIITPRSSNLSQTDTSTVARPLSPMQFQSYHHSRKSEGGYFAPRHLQDHPVLQRTSFPENPTAAQGACVRTPTADQPNLYGQSTSECITPPTEPHDRQNLSRDLSMISNASTGNTIQGPTVEISSARTTSAPPTTDATNATVTPRLREYPIYPNQAFAALQSQIHSTPPHPLRTRSSHPSHHASYSAAASSSSAAAAAAAPRQPSEGGRAESGSKTVGNTPASSPGLFTAPAPPSSTVRATNREGHLHWTYPYPQAPPTETHVADIDIDPISGRKLINQLEIVTEIGRGVHGKVKLARNLNDNTLVAIKIVNRYSKRRRLGKLGNPEDEVKKEVAILKKARHPNIVALLEVIDDPAKKKVYIVLEYVSNGEIPWRREGVKEIVIIERRRIEREARGMGETISSTFEDATILREAKWRRERQERRDRQREKLRYLQVTEGEFWSLEHGGLSEDEIEDVSRVNTQESHASTTAHASDQGLNISSNPALHSFPLGAHISSPQDCNFPRIDSDNEISSPGSQRSQVPMSSLKAVSQSSSSAALEGSMYGAYAPEQSRGRTPSMAGSFLSHQSSDLSNDLFDFDDEFSYVPCLTLPAARQAFRDTVLGLEYLHYQGIIHRDIKPANLLWTDHERVKISDFGVSYLGRPIRDDDAEEVSESDASTLDEAVELAKTVGTPAFYAPELCYTDFSAPRPPVTEKIDVWALGVTLYCMLFARVPFLADDEFSMFKRICEDEVFVPRKRLKAVEPLPPSGPNTRTNSPPLPPPPTPVIRKIVLNSNQREPTDLVYEEIDDDLHDLIKRLFQKDPTKRITLKEVKHHPWILHDIENPSAWLDETDPSRQSHGKKIEVSKEEVADAVIPLTMIDRVRSGIRKIGGALGIGTGRQGSSRKRAKSSATTSAVSPSTYHPNIGGTGRETRRDSLRGDEKIITTLKASREPCKEGEHPLSQSVTASPEITEENPFFTNAVSNSGQLSDFGLTEHDRPSVKGQIGPRRPNPPERAISAVSSTGSTKTVIAHRSLDPRSRTPPPMSPGLPGTPVVIDTVGNSSLGAIFGGSARRLVKKMRSRESTRHSSDGSQGAKRPHSVDRVGFNFDDAYADASIAVSSTFASGHVDPPEVLKEVSPTDRFYAVEHTSAQLVPDTTISGTPPSSEAEASKLQRLSISSSSGRPTTAPADERRGSVPAESMRSPLRSLFPAESTDESFRRAQDQQQRRRQLEMEISGEMSNPTSAAVPEPILNRSSCPPSPDDEIFFRKQTEEQARRHPLTRDNELILGSAMQPIISSSSEDPLTPGMSQSESYPSVPSMFSARSSISADDPAIKSRMDVSIPAVLHETKRPFPSGHEDAHGHGSPLHAEDDAGYTGDRGDNDSEDSDSDEGFLTMPKGKARPKALLRSESVSIGQLARKSATKTTAEVMNTDGSESSTGTVKTVRSEEFDVQGSKGRR
ncbi:MAG: hypothetical protein M1827_002914 [Pycnora praestabilis]|nr:MAG: hypothetical protein M1827_002914 [Pycnora praestabilis]